MYLGLDIGTSSVKAVVMDAQGILVQQSEAQLRISRPHPLWAEQDLEDWWAATHRAVGNLARDVRSTVRGIGLSGQMHGVTLLPNPTNHLSSSMRPRWLDIVDSTRD